MSKHKREERSTWGEADIVVHHEDRGARAKHEDFVLKHRREGGSITTSCVNYSWYLLLFELMFVKFQDGEKLRRTF